MRTCRTSSCLATAKAVLTKLREISQEQKIDPPPEHHFIKADLSLISEAKRVAEAIRARAGPQGIDYLIMTQGMSRLLFTACHQHTLTTLNRWTSEWKVDIYFRIA